ncbi:MAG: hypothetical protein KatS3mg020_0149 [Fimbriimonadales bacterium]|nr:MAG: hypothetical protein KatS3mg020_0149 [Fimbriimonadales bacterium]
MSRLIALLTDYGYVDTYVAQVKAVLLSLCPTCELLDLTHGVAPQHIRSGAYLLATAIPYLPDGTIIMAVVDPGVGTVRRAIAVQGARYTYLAPDNGLLSLAQRDDPPLQAVALENPRYHLPQVSSTFHGRDLFAPVAAHLANGVPLNTLGTPIEPASLVQLPDIEPEFTADEIHCKPLHVDQFGNVVFNLRREAFEQYLRRADIPASAIVSLMGRDAQATRLPLVRTFGEVAQGEPLAYWGSNGYLEVAVNGGSAARSLDIAADSVLIIRFETDES